MPGDFQALLHDVETTLGRLRREIERLQYLILTDELTGLYNRRYLEMRLEEELNRSRRFSRPFSLIFLDLDGFKAVNDQYGHPAGDRLLTEFAEVLRINARTMDVAVRYGGEEFILLLPETGSPDAFEAAQRLQRHVWDRTFLGGRLRITFSGGVASFPDDGTDARALVEQADLALRAAKKWGKNQIVAASRVLPGATAPWQLGVAASLSGGEASRLEGAIPVVPGFRGDHEVPACFWHVGRALSVRGVLAREPGDSPETARYRLDTEQGPQLFERRGDQWFWLPGTPGDRGDPPRAERTERTSLDTGETQSIE